MIVPPLEAMVNIGRLTGRPSVANLTGGAVVDSVLSGTQGVNAIVCHYHHNHCHYFRGHCHYYHNHCHYFRDHTYDLDHTYKCLPTMYFHQMT